MRKISKKQSKVKKFKVVRVGTIEAHKYLSNYYSGTFTEDQKPKLDSFIIRVGKGRNRVDYELCAQQAQKFGFKANMNNVDKELKKIRITIEEI